MPNRIADIEYGTIQHDTSRSCDDNSDSDQLNPNQEPATKVPSEFIQNMKQIGRDHYCNQHKINSAYTRSGEFLTNVELRRLYIQGHYNQKNFPANAVDMHQASEIALEGGINSLAHDRFSPQNHPDMYISLNFLEIPSSDE